MIAVKLRTIALNGGVIKFDAEMKTGTFWKSYAEQNNYIMKQLQEVISKDDIKDFEWA